MSAADDIPSGQTTVESDAHSRLLDAVAEVTKDYGHYDAYDTVEAMASPALRTALVAWLTETGSLVPSARGVEGRIVTYRIGRPAPLD